MQLISLNKIKSSTKKIYKGIPPEDYIFSSKNSFAVCDGVTLLHQQPYPNPSPAAFAAKLAAKTIVKELLANSFKGIQSLKVAFMKANKAIKKYNQSIGLTPNTVDFLEKQYAATVSSYGRIYNGKLYWGQINDCGVMIIDSSGAIVMNKILDRTPVNEYLKSIRTKKIYRKGSPQEHQYFRSTIVNNTNFKYNNKRVRWGVMTGESRAIKFLQTGSKIIKPELTTIFYSDGMIPLLALQSFRQIISKKIAKEKIIKFMKKKEKSGKKFRSERSIIII